MSVRRRAPVALDRSTVLLTGATGGIGEAIARALAARGAALLISGRRGDALDALARELDAGADGRPAGRVRAIVADLADRDDVRRLGERAVAERTEVLIANAALPATGMLVDLHPDEIDRMLEVNLRAPVMLARALAPSMVARGRGQIVLISSLSGKVASPASSMYSATKFGLRGFGLALRADLHPHGVGVTVIAPGFISDAGMYARTGVRLPPGVGTRTPQAVADAVIRAVRRNPAELDVAPPAMRAGAAIGSVAPGLAGWGSRLLGSYRIAKQMAGRQRDRR